MQLELIIRMLKVAKTVLKIDKIKLHKRMRKLYQFRIMTIRVELSKTKKQIKKTQ